VPPASGEETGALEEGRLPSREFESVSDLLVGSSPATLVDRYLADAPIDEVTDFELELFQLTRRPRPGADATGATRQPGLLGRRSDPAQLPPLDWKLCNGENRSVLMNAGTASGRRRRRGEAVSPGCGGRLYQKTPATSSR
jgi:hypothetical protein